MSLDKSAIHIDTSDDTVKFVSMLKNEITIEIETVEWKLLEFSACDFSFNISSLKDQFWKSNDIYTNNKSSCHRFRTITIFRTENNVSQLEWPDAV